MLTQRQYDLIKYIHRVMVQKGVSPSYDEMREQMNLKSKSGIHRLISELEDKKFIRRLPNKARAVEILKMPDELKPSSLIPENANDNIISIPLYGKIACGVPIEAVSGYDSICIPAQLIGNGDHYALTAEGDSMKDAGIMDGDTVIIRRCKTAENGAIVVALVDGYDVTLKRFRRKGNQVALEPANQNYETRIFSADRVEVQGELVGLMRKY